MKPPKRVALYARCSTAEQNTAAQLSELKAFALLRGWALEETCVYIDSGYSGKSTSRPELKRLLSDAGRRHFDLVMVWKLDRFGRSLGDLISMIQGLAEVGVEFCSLRDNLDLSTAQGKLMLHLLGAFAEFERCLIVERTKAGLAFAKSQGKVLGRPKRRCDADIERLRAKGLSIRKIACELGLAKSTVQAALAGVHKTPA